MVHSFHGGVRPAGRKNSTRWAATALPERGPRRVTLPLSWCGGETRVLVKTGDSVMLGQKLAEPIGEGLALHASVSGKVLEVGETAFGRAITLENDEWSTAVAPAGRLPRRDRPEELSPKEILDDARAAAVADMVPGGRPLHQMLREGRDKVRLLLVNGVECEPYVTSTHRLLLEKPGEVLGGIRLMKRALGLDKAVLAVGGDMEDAVAAIQARLPLRKSDIKLVTLRRRYPQGAVKPLVEQVTGRRIPPGGTPLDVECLVVHASTAAALSEAVYDKRPLTSRIITVAGGAINRPGNYRMPFGVTVEQVLEEAGAAVRPGRVLVGGAMTGWTVTDQEVPLGREAAAVLALTARECASYRLEEGVCLHCGRCIDVCPMHLQPLYLRAYAGAGYDDALESLHIDDCIECGACAYACPSHIQLTESIRAAKVRRSSVREEESQG